MASRQEGLNELARVLLDTFSLQERAQLFYELYTRGLSCEDIGVICERIYGHHYSKQQVSFLSSQSKAEVVAWLSRPLSARCLTLYIDATFTPTQCEGSVNQEAYYIILCVLPDGCREVLSVVYHPTEGAVCRQQELAALKERGVEQVDFGGFPMHSRA